MDNLRIFHGSLFCKRMRQQWLYEFVHISHLCFLILGFKLSNWKWTCGSINYIQREEKGGQGSWVLCIVYIQLTFLKELHSQRFHFCKFMEKNTFFQLFPRIPPISHFWTHVLPPKLIWSTTMPWLSHNTLWSTDRGSTVALPHAWLLAHSVAFAGKSMFAKTTWI